MAIAGINIHTKKVKTKMISRSPKQIKKQQNQLNFTISSTISHSKINNIPSLFVASKTETKTCSNNCSLLFSTKTR